MLMSFWLMGADYWRLYVCHVILCPSSRWIPKRYGIGGVMYINMGSVDCTGTKCITIFDHKLKAARSSFEQRQQYQHPADVPEFPTFRSHSWNVLNPHGVRWLCPMQNTISGASKPTICRILCHYPAFRMTFTLTKLSLASDLGTNTGCVQKIKIFNDVRSNKDIPAITGQLHKLTTGKWNKLKSHLDHIGDITLKVMLDDTNKRISKQKVKVEIRDRTCNFAEK